MHPGPLLKIIKMGTSSLKFKNVEIHKILESENLTR